MCIIVSEYICVLQVLVSLSKLERSDKEEFTEEERADAEEVYTLLTPPHTLTPSPGISREKSCSRC